MHYANGREAKVGDTVRGRGYNIKHEIIGLLLSANPSASACNCTVATISRSSMIKCHGFQQPDGSFVFSKSVGGELVSSEVTATIEYGQLDAFVALNTDTGEVLLPEGYEPPLPNATWSPCARP